MAWLDVSLISFVFPFAFWGDELPWVVVLESWFGCLLLLLCPLWLRPLVLLYLSLLERIALLVGQPLEVLLQGVELSLEGLDELLEFLRLVCQVDCVLAHAVLMINTYPRGSASSTVLGFRLAPSTPSRAKVLRTGLAVIARRAYGSIFHED